MKKKEKQVIGVLSGLIVIMAAVVGIGFFTQANSDDVETTEIANQVKSSEDTTKEDRTASSDKTTTTETTTKETTATTEVTTTTESKDTADDSAEASNNGYMFADSDSRYLSDADVAGLSPSQAQYAINEIYARHGLIFSKASNRKAFGKKKWYREREKNADNITLNSYEKANEKKLADIRDN